MRVHLTPKSTNKKTGPIPVSTTEEDSCPRSCPWFGKGCYAKYGPLKLHWKKVSNSERGTGWKDFVRLVAAFPIGQLWRHNQAGDLPGKDKRIDSVKLKQLVKANEGKRGFTYTHKDVEGSSEQAKKNRKLVKYANDKGFIVNLSANGIDHADKLMELGIAPVATVLPSDTAEKTFTSPGGNRIVVCPATYDDDISCATCKMCAFSDRKSIIGFPAHGTATKAVNQKLKVLDNG